MSKYKLASILAIATLCSSKAVSLSETKNVILADEKSTLATKVKSEQVLSDEGRSRVDAHISKQSVAKLFIHVEENDGRQKADSHPRIGDKGAAEGRRVEDVTLSKLPVLAKIEKQSNKNTDKQLKTDLRPRIDYKEASTNSQSEEFIVPPRRKQRTIRSFHQQKENEILELEGIRSHRKTMVVRRNKSKRKKPKENTWMNTEEKNRKITNQGLLSITKWSPLGNEFRGKNRKRRASQTKHEQDSESKSDDRKTVCDTWLSCKGQCRDPPSFSFNSNLTCYCDAKCENFEDCCADYEHFCKLNATGNFTIHSQEDIFENSSGTETPTSLPSFNSSSFLSPEIPMQPSIRRRRSIQERTQAREDSYRTWEYWSCERTADKTFVWMIIGCPSAFTDITIKSRCVSGFSLTKVESAQALLNARPVYTTDGKVFKNRYCAKCHGLSVPSLKVYGVSFDCDFTAPESMSNEEKLDFLVSRCGEKISWVIPRGSPRRTCFKVASCSNNTDDCDARCTNGTVGIVSSANGNYRNSFCYSESSLSCQPKIQTENGGPPLLPPFSIIFNFGTNDRSTPLTSIIECTKGHVYNPYTEVCASDFHSSPPESSTNDKYRVTLWIRINDVDDSTCDINIVLALYKTFPGPWKFTNIETKEEHSYLNVYFDVEATYKNRRNRRDAMVTISLDRVLHFTSPFNMTICGTEYEVFKATKRILSCSNLRKYEKSEYATFVSPTASVYINESGEVLRARDYYTNGTNVTIGPIYVCHAGRHEVSNCSGVFLKVEHFIIFPNRSIYVNVSGRMLNQSEYFVHNGTTYVCTDLPPRREKTWADDPALSWLTLMCMLLSIAGLVFFLVTYLLFSELRTIPGVNLMNLALSTLLAQVTWLTGVNQTDTPITCTVVAALLQYFYLVSFTWTSIIAYDTWRAFSSKSYRAALGSSSEKLRKSLKYIALGWLPLSIFVITCVSLDQSEAVTIGYGSQQFCWITNGLATVYVFAIPIALALITDVIFYALTIRAIKTTASQAQMAAENSKRRGHFGIYVRLASVMGFTWVFGFGAALLWSPLWYVFVSLNCLQGVYLAAAFALSDRARRLYCELLGLQATHVKTVQCL